METVTEKQPKCWWCWQRIVGVPLFLLAILIAYLTYLWELR